MSIIVEAAAVAPTFASSTRPELTLGAASRGFRGRILGLRAQESGGLAAEEIERRLLELGFVEGAHVELIHEGLFGRDPIAMKVDDMRVALRRKEAASLTVQLHGAEFVAEAAE